MLYKATEQTLTIENIEMDYITFGNGTKPLLMIQGLNTRGIKGSAVILSRNNKTVENVMKHMSDTFQEYLMYLIGEKKLTNAEVYKRAIVTKQLFSKIKLNPEYHLDKATTMRLCVGARLNLDETKDLLARAGYALSPSESR